MTAGAQSDLDLIRTTPVPRDERVCGPLAQRFESSSARVVYWCMWLVTTLFVSSLPGVVVMLLITYALRSSHHDNRAAPDWLMIVFAVCWAATYAASSVYFAKWMRRRREDIRALFRDGQLLDAELGGAAAFGTRGGAQLRLSFTFYDADQNGHTFFVTFSRDVRWPNDRKLPVLFRMGSRFCAAFVGADGSMIARRLRR